MPVSNHERPQPSSFFNRLGSPFGKVPGADRRPVKASKPPSQCVRHDHASLAVTVVYEEPIVDIFVAGTPRNIPGQNSARSNGDHDAKRTREYTWHENISGWRDAALGYAAQTASASPAPSNKPLTCEQIMDQRARRADEHMS